jgi:hypothetical protein
MSCGLLVALYLALVGSVLTQREELDFFLPPNGADRSVLLRQYRSSPTHASLDQAAAQLAGYASWDSFVDNCCCAAFDNQTGRTAQSVEKWICANGKVKERLRRVRGGTNALGTVRGLCERDFKNGCRVFVTAAPPYWVSLAGCAAGNVTAAEMELW